MLELNTLRNNKSEIVERLRIRGDQYSDLVEQILDKDADRRSTQTELDEQLAEMNKLSKEIGNLFREGKQEEANAMKARTGELKERTQELKDKLTSFEQALQELLYQVPNAPQSDVPKGNTDQDNQIIFTADIAAGKDQQPHWEITEKHDLIDFELGVKVTGAGFPIYKGKGARLQRALINFFLDEAIKAGYQEFIPPHMVNEDSGYGTGQLPDKEGQMYHVTTDNLYLIPTAEVPLTNMFRDVIVSEEELPIKITGYTPCFRREAGSYGKDVRGLNRLHQFDKVEIVEIEHPDRSYQTLERMVEHVKGLLEKLELPYRIAKLCGGDLGFAAAKTLDMEVFSPAQDKWLEVSSVSNFETYQANRMKLRYRSGSNKPQLVHTLNGSALALPRIVAAILENRQDGNTVSIPEALVPYTGFESI